MPKISQLPSSTVPSNSDYFPIVDVAGTITEKITRNDFLKGAALPANTVDAQSIASNAVTTAKILDSNVTTAKIADNNVTAAKLATNAITLGYAQRTTDATAGTTVTLISGLTASVTIPSGGRRVKITAWVYDLFVAGQTGVGAEISIWDGTVGSGTQLSAALAGYNSGSAANSVTAMAVVTPSAGAKTYNVGLRAVTGTATIGAATTFPSFILVEVI